MARFQYRSQKTSGKRVKAAADEAAADAQIVDLWDALRISLTKKGRRMPTTEQLTGLTKLTCEFNLIDHAQGDQYLYVRVDTEVPTIAGDWDDSGQVAEVFSEMIEALPTDGESFTLDEGVRYYREGDLMA